MQPTTAPRNSQSALLAPGNHTPVHSLLCPQSRETLVYGNGAYRRGNDCQPVFPVEEGIIKAFLPHPGFEGDVTALMKSFYEENPFPNYEENETVGSLIEKSYDRVFPEMLNRSIPFNAQVLEVGCGTGQLGNFLSIPGRRVLSADMCLNSLRLAQRFKESNNLANATFAQMNLFALPLRQTQFDVVICLGVLHHTDNPYKGFKEIIKMAKPGGFVIIGLYNSFGRLQTRMRANLFKVLGPAFSHLDPYLTEHKVTAEKRQSWYMDQYRNPHESLHTIDEALGWFDNNGVDFVRSFPSTIYGSSFDLEYKRSIFDPESRGSRTDRLLSQLKQMVNDKEGGLFVMVGRKR